MKERKEPKQNGEKPKGQQIVNSTRDCIEFGYIAGAVAPLKNSEGPASL